MRLLEGGKSHFVQYDCGQTHVGGISTSDLTPAKEYLFFKGVTDRGDLFFLFRRSLRVERTDVSE